MVFEYSLFNIIWIQERQVKVLKILGSVKHSNVALAEAIF